MKCRLVGIDSSTVHTAFSVFDDGKLIDYLLIDKSKIKNKEIKFESMCNSILDELDKLNPDIIVIELTSVTRNAVAQRQLTMIIGVVYSWAIRNDCEFVSYRASEWRALISKEKKPRKREELKAWAIQQVNDIFSLDIEVDDIAEAILIGQARINQFKE